MEEESARSMVKKKARGFLRKSAPVGIGSSLLAMLYAVLDKGDASFADLLSSDLQTHLLTIIVFGVSMAVIWATDKLEAQERNTRQLNALQAWAREQGYEPPDED